VWRCARLILSLSLAWSWARCVVVAAEPSATDWTARFSHLAADDAARLKRELLDALPRRMVTAAKVVLQDKAYVEWKLRYAPTILSLARGERLSAAQLLALWNEADRLEKSALQRLARAYRIQLYRMYRAQRSEYDRRQAAWDEIAAAWQAAGGWADEQPLLIEWLKAAIWASRPGTLAALPPAPKFKPAPPRATPNLQISKSPNPPRRSSVARSAPSLSPRTSEPSRGSSPVAATMPRVSPPFIPRESPQIDPGRATTLPPPGSTLASTNMTPAVRRATPDRAPSIGPAAAPRPQNGVRINLDEIAVRVAGFNLALAALEQEFNRAGPWNAAQLAPLIEELGELATRHADMRPYYQYVSAGDARRLGELRSCVPAIRLAAGRILTVRKTLDAGGEPLADRQPRDQIERLSRRLAEIAAAYHAVEKTQP